MTLLSDEYSTIMVPHQNNYCELIHPYRCQLYSWYQKTLTSNPHILRDLEL